MHCESVQSSQPQNEELHLQSSIIYGSRLEWCAEASHLVSQHTDDSAKCVMLEVEKYDQFPACQVDIFCWPY